ncbi:MAG: DUF2079 domain-containing protein [Chloroflexi bacterium]|nr:DUF2079 domain-containing protein [Chloroflexota bacterium]
MMQVFVEFGILFALAILLGAFTCATKRRGVPEGNRSIRFWDRMFIALAGGYVGLFAALAMVRYLTFHTGYLDLNTAWDLGQYGQLVWNSLHGRILEGTFVRDTATFLGKSFTPIVLAFVPLYAVWASPIVLLIVQVLGLGLAGLPIYWFARHQLGGAWAWLIALTYYLHPGLQHIGLTEFHEIALVVPLLSFAAFFLLRAHYRGLFVCLALALLVKEEIGLVVTMFGAYIFLVQRRRVLGASVALFGIVWIVFLLQVVIPFFRGAEYGGAFYYFGQGEVGGGGARYSYLGRSVPEIVTTLLTQPGKVLAYILIPEKIAYGLHLLAPLAFVPMVGVEILALALPTFAYSVLSTYPLQYEIRSYYFSPLLPFLFYATVSGVRRVLLWRGELRYALAVTLCVSSVGAYFLNGAGPLARHFQPQRYLIDARTHLGNALLAQIPPEAVVIAQNEFLAHLSNRQFLYEVPVIPHYHQADYLVVDTTPGSWFYVHPGHWRYNFSSGFFETIVARDNYMIARRKPSEHRIDARFDQRITLLGYSMVVTETKPWGTTLRPVLEWRAEQSIAESYHIVINVVDRQGHRWATDAREPQDGVTPTTRWQVGKSVSDQYDLRLPPTMPTADYFLTVAVCARDQEICLPAADGAGNALGEEIEFTRVRVAKNKHAFAASDLHLLNRLSVDLGEVRLIGFVPPREKITPGELLQVGLYWRAREKPRGDYVVAVQLRDVRGRVAFEQTARPANNTYPTTEWDAGEVLLDWHDFDLPRDVASGEYQIFAVLRDAATGTHVGETLISPISVVK